MKIYLAGKMTGLTKEKMTKWRNEAEATLNPLGYTLMDPVKTAICDITEPLMVVSSNTVMIKAADVILMELSAPREQASFGTIAELGMCWALGKPVVAFCEMGDFEDEPDYLSHPWIAGTVRHLYYSLDEALDAIIRTFPARG